MSDNIDYDELDKAVSEAIKSRSASATKPAAKPATRTPVKPVAKAPVKPKTSSGPVPIPAVQPTVTPKPSPKQPRFMEFTRRPAHATPRVAKSVVVAKTPVSQKPTPTKPVQSRPKLVAATPSAHVVKPIKSAPAHTISPQTAAKIRQQRLLAQKRQLQEHKRRELLLKQQQAARKTVPATVAPKPKSEIAEAAARAKATMLAQEQAEHEAPNANNYSIGVRSPFLTDAKVEKRPLGQNIPESSLSKLKSTKNVYSQKSPVNKKHVDKHTIVQTEHKTSGWVWTLIVLFIIIAGGALGYLAYLLVFTNQF